MLLKVVAELLRYLIYGMILLLCYKWWWWWYKW